MKILLIGDLHLGNYPRFGQLSSSVLPTRLQEQKDVLEQIYNIIISNKITHVEFAGDFFHSDKAITIECLNVAKEFFNKLQDANVNFYATRGNHDLSNKTFLNSYQYSLTPLMPDSREASALSIYRLHYDIPVDYSKIRNYDLVVAHKMPLNSKSPANYIFDEGVDWKELARNNRLVVFGHNHHTQQLSDNCYVLGSVMQLTFGDIHKAGVWLLQNGILTFCPLVAPEFITVSSGDMVNTGDNNYYRVIGDNTTVKSERVIVVREPTYFEQRLQSTTKEDILKEWLKIQQKDIKYFDLIKDDISRDLYNFNHIKNLKLTKINLSNFGPFYSAEVDVNKGLILVEGKNEGFSSNGSGKSFLCDSIYYALYGETTRGVTGDDIIRKYPKKQKDCRVEVYITGGKDTEYRVVRSRKDGLIILEKAVDSDNWTELTEGLKLKESQEMLEKLLGFNKIIFTASTYFSQDHLLLLTRLGASEKNSIINTLLGFDDYDKLGDTLLERINTFKAQRNTLDVDLAVLNGSITTSNTNLTEARERETTLLERGKTKRAALESEKKALEELQNSISVDKNDGNKIELLEGDLKNSLNSLDSITKDLETADSKLEEFRTTSTLDTLKGQLVELKVEATNLQKSQSTLLSEIQLVKVASENTTCTYCGSTISSENKEKYIEDKTRLLKEVQESITSVQTKTTDTTARLAEVTKQLNILESEKISIYTHFKETKLKIDSLTADLDRERAKETEEEVKVRAVGEKSRVIAYMDSELNQLREDFKKSKEYVETCIQEIDKLKNTVDLKLSQIQEVSESIAILEFWKEALSYKGVKSLLLDGFCNEFNTLLKDYISEISNGIIAAEFSPTSTTKAGESRNKLDIRIEISGLERSYNSLSSGEKRRVDIAVCLAFSRWIQLKYNLETSLLGIQIFDELFDGLDSSAEDCIAPVLLREGETKAIFIVSHTKELSNYAQRVITVQKRDMVAEII